MKVVVAGGGLAGLAAATVLAEGGAEVTVVEKERFLGGRAGAWPDTLADGTPFQMERGFHAFFRQYHNLRALMRRVDPTLAHLTPQADYPIYAPGGRAESFRDLPTRTPQNIVELVRRTDTLGLRDLLRVRALRTSAMLGYGPHTYARWDHVSAAAYLSSLRFPEEAKELLFGVFAHSFFNPEEEFSAGELLMQFHFYFTGNPDGLLFDTLDRPFSAALFDPLRAYLEARGARFRLGAAVERVEREPLRVHLRGEGGPATLEADALVLALNVPGLRALAAASPDLGEPLRGQIGALEVTWPFAVWRLWLDRPVRPERPAFAGTAQTGLLENISVYEKVEDESRAWAKRTGGSVVELHGYAIPPHLGEEAIRADLLTGLHTHYPETRTARVLDERFLLERDCPAFPPGSHARRPTVRTALPEVVLAGDFVRLPFPSALMERAVSSGFLGANVLLRRDAEPVHRPPATGLLSALRL
ncbi:MAG TPA: FAD-dependent oxidoreductase [Polyangiaceae bacterium LLY-WYZ-15_(1-7)]|nr:FAD-dependent oxidoreductase [Polyangiaceae bacterium LLY-WYZ-15_(1-7)]HJL11018.1 FAD-dependent oxidoreductase [Polyangiaceae bacterium LLY-WYZ-15_(1-7)]